MFLERQAGNGVDVTTDRARTAGKRSTELQGKLAMKGHRLTPMAIVRGICNANQNPRAWTPRALSGMERRMAKLSVREDSTIAFVREISKGAPGKRSDKGTRDPTHS